MQFESWIFFQSSWENLGTCDRRLPFCVVVLEPGAFIPVKDPALLDHRISRPELFINYGIY